MLAFIKNIFKQSSVANLKQSELNNTERFVKDTSISVSKQLGNKIPEYATRTIINLKMSGYYDCSLTKDMLLQCCAYLIYNFYYKYLISSMYQYESVNNKIIYDVISSCGNSVLGYIQPDDISTSDDCIQIELKNIFIKNVNIIEGKTGGAFSVGEYDKLFASYIIIKCGIEKNNTNIDTIIREIAESMTDFMDEVNLCLIKLGL